MSMTVIENKNIYWMHVQKINNSDKSMINANDFIYQIKISFMFNWLAVLLYNK